MPNTEIKLIATDLDGTLLRDDHLTLSPANREALTSAAKAGIEVVIATGRSLAAVAPQVLELPFLHYFITCNGSITTDREGHILRAAPLPLDTTLEILEHLTTMGDFAVQLYADQKMYLSRTDWEHRDFIHLPAFHLKTLFSSEESIVDDLMERARQPGTHLEKINMPYLTPEQKAEIKAWLWRPGTRRQHHGVQSGADRSGRQQRRRFGRSLPDAEHSHGTGHGPGGCR